MYMVIAGALLILASISNLTIAAIVMCVQGFCTGVCDSATNVILCQTWKDKSSAYIQCLYFFFALGSTIAPLMAAPYLFSNAFRIPYYITCCVLFMAGAALLPLAFLSRDHEPQEQQDSARVRQITRSSSETRRAGTGRNGRLKRAMEWCSLRQNYSVAVVVILTTVMIMAYSGMEIIYWEFIAAYLMSIPGLHILPEQASYMTAAVNYAFTLLRGLAVFIVWKVRPQVVIFANLLVLIIACLLLLHSDSLLVVWVGNIMIGAAFSTVYPQIYAYTVSQIKISNYIGSLLVFASGLTAVYYPTLVAREIRKSHNFLIVLVLISIAVTICAFIALLIFTRAFARSSPAVVESGYEQEPCVTRL